MTSAKRATSAARAEPLAELSNLSETLAEFATELEKNGLPGSLALALAVLAGLGALAWAIQLQLTPLSTLGAALRARAARCSRMVGSPAARPSCPRRRPTPPWCCSSCALR